VGCCALGEDLSIHRLIPAEDSVREGLLEADDQLPVQRGIIKSIAGWGGFHVQCAIGLMDGRVEVGQAEEGAFGQNGEVTCR